jgi:hypothetical protein
MLKPKSLIFALSLVPFLLASLQLTTRGGSTQPGSPSGGVQASPPSTPPPRPDNRGTDIITIPNAQSVIISTQGQGGLSLSPQAQAALNQLVPGILGSLGGASNTAALSSLLTGGAGSQEAAAQITASLTTAGISPQLAAALVNALNGLFSPSTGSLPSAMLVGAKNLKGNTTVAQAGAAFSVNINKLSAAINAYNGIVIESNPPTLKRLSQDQSFVGIGNTLKQLRKAIP